MRKITLASAAVLLVSCESVKESLGMTHYQADEFNVKQHDALEIPPNYNLVPPRKKDEKGNSVPIKEAAVKAQKAIGGSASSSALSEKSLKDLRDKTGKADASIREKIDAEASEGADNSIDKKLDEWKKELARNAASITSGGKSNDDAAAAKATQATPSA